MAYVLSQPVTVTVTPTVGLPDWVPPYDSVNGHFNDVTRLSTGVPMLGSEIDPDYYMPDGSDTPYRLLFHGTSGFRSSWDSQCGGAFAPDHGEHGSHYVIGGGHYTWDCMSLVRFDIATGTYSHHYFPPFCASYKSIIGGTVATLTGTVSNTPSTDITNAESRQATDRIGTAGQWCKTADGVDIPGTDLETVATTVWHPAPIHSNAGLHVVPAPYGGTNGTFVLNGHDQTGMLHVGAEQSIFTMDLSVQPPVWERWKMGSWADQYSFPGLEWDSHNNLLWYIRVGSSPVALKFPDRTHKVTTTSGTYINQATSYCANACFMPSRKLMVSMFTTGPAAAATALDSSNEWMSTISVTAGDRHRFITLGADFIPSNTGTILTFQKSLVSSSGPWLDISTYTADIPASVPPYAPGIQYDTTADRALATTIWYRAGIKTGEYAGTGSIRTFMHSRKPMFKAWSVDGFDFDAPTSTIRFFDLTVPGDFGSSDWPQDHGNLMYGSGYSGDTHVVNDRLEYCEYDDCLFFIDRPITTASSVPSGVQHTLNLWRLIPPAIGLEETQPWVWEKEIIQDGTPDYTGVGMVAVRAFPCYGGRTKYIPSLKCILINERPEGPAQVIRSKNWA